MPIAIYMFLLLKTRLNTRYRCQQAAEQYLRFPSPKKKQQKFIEKEHTFQTKLDKQTTNK